MMFTDLLWEVESEILSRVPATFLKKFRFTCKRWYNLTKEPSFIKKNSGKAATQMLLKKKKSVLPFNIDFHGIHNRYDQFIEFTGKLESPKDSEDVKVSEISHCEGLILCKTKDKRLVVWNPCTGQTRWIQSSTMHHSCFLGYENNNKSCNSYKILRCSYDNNDQGATVAKFEIYEFNSDSWRVLDVTHEWFACSEVSVSLKGDTYWLDSDEVDGLINHIVRFDFTRERFERLPLPFPSHGYNEELAVLSVVREEKLAVLRQLWFDMVNDLKMKIWLTNTQTDEAKGLSWSEFLVVDFNKLGIHGMTRASSFLVDEETKKVLCCDTDMDDDYRTTVYVVGEDIHKEVYREIPTGSWSWQCPLLISYVPSLVEIPTKAVTLVSGGNEISQIIN
ncbi:unnamed protein product [Microthlaspi erraticum]|uniref:F-box domain-containing protein n=1 Tax=Microthlaspi erraticum TaxID=1685480 RepID=A0A6D2KT95_9BRAS|nr:unnamed protein product [Microthlaspi erraticum]